MSLAGKSVSVLVSRWLVSPIELLVSVVVVRVIGVEGKGIVVLLMVTVAILSTIGNLGTPAAAIYYLRKGVYNPRELIANFSILAAIFSILIWGLVLLQGEWFVRLFFKSVSISSWLIWLAVPSLPVMMLTSFISAIQLGSGLSKFYNQLILTTSLIHIVATLLLIVVFPLGITGAVVANILALVIPLVVAAYQLIKTTCGYSWRIRWRTQLNLLHYGIRHYPATITSMIFNRVGNFILAYFVGIQAVGYYSVANMAYNAVLSIPRAVNTLLTGKAASLESFKSALLVARSSRHILAVMFCAIIPIAFISPWIIPLLYGANFTQAVIPLIILLIASLFVGVFATIQTYFSATNRPGLNSTISIITSIINIILAFSLVPVSGITGMALAVLLAEVIAFSMFLFWFSRVTGIPVQSALLLTKQDIADWVRLMNNSLQRMRLLLRAVSGR